MNREWPLWEVFIRSQHGLAHRHVGSLHAPDADAWMQQGGKRGRHTEHLGYLLAEMQFVQRAYPGTTW